MEKEHDSTQCHDRQSKAKRKICRPKVVCPRLRRQIVLVWRAKVEWREKRGEEEIEFLRVEGINKAVNLERRGLSLRLDDSLAWAAAGNEWDGDA